MTLRAPANRSRGRGYLPGSCENLEPGEETSAHGHAGRQAAPADLLASPERPAACVTALARVRACT
jgi:hypothetical protein